MPTTAEPFILDPALMADPYGGYGAFLEQGTVLAGKAMDGRPAWYVLGQDEVRAVLSDHRFVNNPASIPGRTVDNVRDKMMESFGVPAELTGYITGTILDQDQPHHTRLRRLVSRAFTVRRVTDMLPRVEEIAADLLDGLTSPVDLIPAYTQPLPMTVISELVGVPEADRPRWGEWALALVSMSPERMPAALRAIVDHVHELAQSRREEPADDLVTALVRARDDDGDQLSDTELVTLVLTLVLAGHETTVHLIGNSVVALLGHPDQLDLLRRDPARWPAAINELMRWCGPVQFTQVRYAAEDVEIGGVAMRAGDIVQPILVSSNFDPRVYDDPQRLDITRRPAVRGEGHVGFGHGLHYCLGAALARQEAEVALRALFTRFPGIALDSDEPAWVPAPGVRKLATLPVRLH